MRAIFSVCCARARDHAAKHGQVLPHAAPNKCCAATGARNPCPLMGSVRSINDVQFNGSYTLP